MEPFRPLVDLMVFRWMKGDDEFTQAHKRMLFNCLNLDILSGGQHHSVSYAIEREVQSLGNALASKDEGLILPGLLDLKQHRYE